MVSCPVTLPLRSGGRRSVFIRVLWNRASVIQERALQQYSTWERHTQTEMDKCWAGRANSCRETRHTMHTHSTHRYQIPQTCINLPMYARIGHNEIRNTYSNSSEQTHVVKDDSVSDIFLNYIFNELIGKTTTHFLDFKIAWVIVIGCSITANYRYRLELTDLACVWKCSWPLTPAAATYCHGHGSLPFASAHCPPCRNKHAHK